MTRTLQKQITWYTAAQWAMGGAMLIASLCFYFTWYRPATRELRRLHLSITQQQELLKTAQAQAHTLPTLQADVYRLQARVEHNNKILPRQPELATFMKDIATLCQQSAVQKFTCKPGAPRRMHPVSEVPVTMSFEGDFISVYQFLRQSEDMQRLTRVRDLSIRSMDAKAGQVEVQMAMNVYFSEE